MLQVRRTYGPSWRRAIADIFGGDMIATVELHAIELAKEQSRGR